MTESPKGTSRRDREKRDFDKDLEVISKLDPQISLSSVKDHLRLGKFDPESAHTRRILVKFLRASEAASVLSKPVGVKAPLSIKPDLSPQDRRRDSALMKERWALIQSGVNTSEIKIKGFRLLVCNKVYAQFRLGAVVREK